MTHAPKALSPRAIDAAIETARAERAQAIAALFAALRKPAAPVGVAQPA